VDMPLMPEPEGDPRATLREALRAVADDHRGGVDTRRLGRWVARLEGRIASCRRLERAGLAHNVALWRLRELRAKEAAQ